MYSSHRNIHVTAIRPPSASQGVVVESFRRNRIHLVDKDDRRCVFPCHSKDISDHSRSLREYERERGGPESVSEIYVYDPLRTSHIADRRLTSPRYFCTNSEPTTRMKLAVVELATALTNMVFPVPVSEGQHCMHKVHG